ncbi:MAG: sigma factor [Bryobacteraceae bacterium]
MSQISVGRRYCIVDASSEVVESTKACEAPPDFESTFRSQYQRIARVIGRVVRDPARAEEIAVDVFVKLWRNPHAQGQWAEAWLHRVAVRHGLDELRRRTRQAAASGCSASYDRSQPLRKSTALQRSKRKYVWRCPRLSIARQSCWCCAVTAFTYHELADRCI